jgi:hypothetical protein
MKVLSLFAFLVGLYVVPSFHLWNPTATNEGGFVGAWWIYLLGAIWSAVVGWLLGFVLPLPAYGFAAGYLVGNVAALGTAWFVPESPVLHFLAAVLLFLVSVPMYKIASARSDRADLRRFFK